MDVEDKLDSPIREQSSSKEIVGEWTENESKNSGEADGSLKTTESLQASDLDKLKEEKMARRQTRRQTRTQDAEYSLQLEEKEEPQFLKELKETEDEKITAQDLLLNVNLYTESERLGRGGKEATPPPRLPTGGVKVAETKYWIPKPINPLEIELRKYQMKELKDAFDYLEDPKTGMVHVGDVATIVRACGFEPKHGEVADILDKINPYYPGYLSFEEFTQVFKFKVDQKDPIQEIERAFKLMDLSKTGKITLEDLKQVSQFVDYDVNDEELQQMIDEAYPSPDGDATITGFVHLMTQKNYFDDPDMIREKKKPSFEKKQFKKSYKTSSNMYQSALRDWKPDH